MKVDIKEVIANIENYEDWDCIAYPLQKEEAEVIVNALKNLGGGNEHKRGTVRAGN